MNATHHIPSASASGSYILVLVAEVEKIVPIGAKGLLKVPPGSYYYCGSAFGPGGLRARVGRHARPVKVHRWHIDYLRHQLAVREVWISRDGINQEHTWASLLNKAHRSNIPMLGFGSSDCHCSAHLFHFKKPLQFETFRKWTRSSGTEHLEILRPFS